jgi:hypothetical protein
MADRMADRVADRMADRVARAGNIFATTSATDRFPADTTVYASTLLDGNPLSWVA